MIPKRIILIALVFGLIGLEAARDIISGLFDNRISLNLSVLMLPISFGLLRGRNNARRFAEGFMILTYFILGIASVYVLFSSGPVTAQLAGRTLDAGTGRLMAMALILGTLTVTVIFHRLLRSRRSLDFFRPSREENERLLSV